MDMAQRVKDISNGEGTAYWLYKDKEKNVPMTKDDCDIKEGDKLVNWLLLPINDSSDDKPVGPDPNSDDTPVGPEPNSS
jgi:hypothetical protein